MLLRDIDARLRYDAADAGAVTLTIYAMRE